ncbi:hypothetical protein PPL_12019 [Heterostelium album PN500]|uniref:Uncharacterized protein n=1 Tax=Heterostelium pallidum (strain ATCC 26659 / Pp 5 / PN500) TaxID=670386 RepID=D3BV47_HETP5|nr:hypothetical protein PPL_12019 [Heterostelium album PN500]EFA74985.1 hypothetical protein PPL_12019 [Heterostelium album PN500]|eukprot:XP_020427119.1 hypothetical protein PPL_12019 [Heterostelium album PN500]
MSKLGDKRKKSKYNKQLKKRKREQQQQQLNQINFHYQPFLPVSFSAIVDQCIKVIQLPFRKDTWDSIIEYFLSVYSIGEDDYDQESVALQSDSSDVEVEDSKQLHKNNFNLPAGTTSTAGVPTIIVQNNDTTIIRRLESKVASLEKEILRIKSDQNQLYKNNLNQYQELLGQIIKASQLLNQQPQLQQPMYVPPPPPPPPPPPKPAAVATTPTASSSSVKNPASAQKKSSSSSGGKQFNISLADITGVKLRKTGSSLLRPGETRSPHKNAANNTPSKRAGSSNNTPSKKSTPSKSNSSRGSTPLKNITNQTNNENNNNNILTPKTTKSGLTFSTSILSSPKSSSTNKLSQLKSPSPKSPSPLTISTLR